MMAILRAIPRTVWTHVITLVIGAIAGILLFQWWTTPRVTTVTLPGHTTVVTVDKPVLVPRDVVRYVQDQAEVARLLTEAEELKLRITVLTETLARVQSTGGGPVQFVDRPVPGATEVRREVHFADWRLTFDAVDKPQPVATYTLNQKFEALTAVGKDGKGQPTAMVRLFEIGPGETRTELTDAKTTLIRANPDKPRWRASPAIQAGIGVGLTSTGVRSTGAVVGLQWLKRGTSLAAEDTTWSLVSPLVFASPRIVEVGILPLSANLGRIKYVPLNDIWISPLITFGVTRGGVSFGRAGIALTATF